MSGIDWQWPLQPGESLLWQGRPAPRCYIWRQWKLALAATLLLLASSFWWLLAYQLMVSEGAPWWLQLLPAPLVVLTSWFGPVRLLLARLEWEQLFYALSDRRLLVRSGSFSAQVMAVPLADFTSWQQKNYGAQLASIRFLRNDLSPLVLHCLEQPQNLICCLPQHLQQAQPQSESV